MFARIIYAFLVAVLAIKNYINAAPLKFPLTLGGFSSDTYIEGIKVTG